MIDRCAQVGPRGGRCRRNAQVIRTSRVGAATLTAAQAGAMDTATSNWYALDFCAAHNQMVLDGHTLQCRKCGTTAGTPRPATARVD